MWSFLSSLISVFVSKNHHTLCITSLARAAGSAAWPSHREPVQSNKYVFFPFFPCQHLNPVSGVLCPSPCPQAPCLLPPSCCETNLGATRVPRGGPHLVPGVSPWRGWEGAGHGVWAAAGEALTTGALGRVDDVLWSLFTCSAVTCQSCQDTAVFGGCIWQVPALSFVGSPSS